MTDNITKDVRVYGFVFQIIMSLQYTYNVYGDPFILKTLTLKQGYTITEWTVYANDIVFGHLIVL